MLRIQGRSLVGESVASRLGARAKSLVAGSVGQVKCQSLGGKDRKVFCEPTPIDLRVLCSLLVGLLGCSREGRLDGVRDLQTLSLMSVRSAVLQAQSRMNEVDSFRAHVVGGRLDGLRDALHCDFVRCMWLLGE